MNMDMSVKVTLQNLDTGERKVITINFWYPILLIAGIVIGGALL